MLKYSLCRNGVEVETVYYEKLKSNGKQSSKPPQRVRKGDFPNSQLWTSQNVSTSLLTLSLMTQCHESPSIYITVLAVNFQLLSYFT